LAAVRLADRQFKFIIKHYAGAVCYTTTDWIVKNNDSIPDAWDTCLASSSDAVLASMSRSGTSPSGFRKPTIATTFTKSMTSLVETLNATRCAFIRCVKPNAEMKPKVFDRQYVVQQLRSLGILQSCEVLKIGLPFRIKYSELKQALAGAAAVADELFKDEPEEVLIAALLYVSCACVHVLCFSPCMTSMATLEAIGLM
jgi:myosin heavy subunit